MSASVFTKEILKDMVERPDNYSLQELQKAYDQTSIALTSIGTQLEKADLDRKVDGKYADPTWYHKTKMARRLTGGQHQVLARVIKARKLKEQGVRKAAAHKSRERIFIQLVKAKLTGAEFDALWDEAEEIRLKQLKHAADS